MWPVSSAIRSIFQSRMVLAGKTYWMTAPMGIRVLVMLAAAYFLPGLRLEDPVGAAILVAGISTEALLASIVARFALPSPREVAHDEPAITASQSRKVRFASRNCLDDPDVWQAGPNGSPFADPRPDYHRCRLAGGLEFLVHPGRAHL